MYLIKKPKKSLGQNFLTDNNIIRKIIQTTDLKNKSIMEIGSGYGNLTEKILSMKPKKILAIEKDKELYSFLKNKFQNQQNIKIINCDFLELIKRKNLDKKVIVFGNLPYNISTKILSSFILLKEWPPWFDMLILMFQKEVAERIIAETKTKEYGRLSILCNWRLEIKKQFNISKNCFLPKPSVDSTLLTFKPKKNIKFNLRNPESLEKVTRVLFSNRRKMINKNIKKLFFKEKNIVRRLKLNLSQRPEELSLDTYYKIAIEYENLFD